MVRVSGCIYKRVKEGGRQRCREVRYYRESRMGSRKREEEGARVKTQDKPHCGEWVDVGMRGLGADWSGILGSSEY